MRYFFWVNSTSGQQESEAFCGTYFREAEFEYAFNFAKNSPNFADRELIYQLLEQLAAVNWGKKMIFITMGVLVWLTDRSQILQANPECVWRYSILRQLVSDRSCCKEYIGDSGYLRIRDYLSQGEYYSEGAPAVIVADEFTQ
jgi:hypothetical protein